MAGNTVTLTVRIAGDAMGGVAALKGVQLEAAKADGVFSKFGANASSASSKVAEVGKKALMGLGVAAVAGGIAAVKMGADFQSAMTSLVTGAGESESNIKAVGDGILSMAGKVGVGAGQLAKGMYLIESAGYHGAAGLSVLKAAAEGSKVGAADMATVADGLTTALNDYHLPASKAAEVTSQLVATVARGKTHMEDLSGAMAAVLPAASAAHVGLAQVLGAMATLTAAGTPAADAATYLKQTILQLSNPTAKARQEMEALGLSAIDISGHLGQRGLTGTLAILTDAIQRKMGPAGIVMIDQLKKSASSTTGFQKALANLPPVQQTYVGALANMVGGTKSMQAALELSGGSAATFNQNVKEISHTTTEAGGHVQGWSKVQQDFNQKLAEAKASLGSLAIKIGEALIPAILAVVSAVQAIVGWFEKHKVATAALAGAIVALLAPALIGLATGFGLAVAAALPLIAAAAPIIAMCAGIGAAAYELYQHWGTVWNGIKRIALDVWHFLEQYGQYIALLFGPEGAIAAAIIELYKHWGTVWGGIKSAAKAAYDFLDQYVFSPIVTAFNAIKSVVQTLYNVWKKIWDDIASALKTVWDNTLGPIINTIKSAVGGVADAIGKVADAGNKLKNLGGTALHYANPLNWGIPGLASGTDYAPGGVTLVGEQGPELVNLPRGSQVVPAARTKSLMSGGSTSVTVYAQSNADPHEIGAAVAWEMRFSGR